MTTLSMFKDLINANIHTDVNSFYLLVILFVSQSNHHRSNALLYMLTMLT